MRKYVSYKEILKSLRLGSDEGVWVSTMKSEHMWSSSQDRACGDIFYDRFGDDLSFQKRLAISLFVP